MKSNPTWSIILGGVVLIFLGYTLGGFFRINYFIGAAGILLGFYNLYKKS